MIEVFLDRYDSFCRKNQGKKVETLTSSDFEEYHALEDIYGKIPEEEKYGLALLDMGSIVCGKSKDELTSYLDDKNNEINRNWRGEK